MDYCVYLDFQGWKPEVWAAWVQAVGSVLAILVAIWIPYRAERASKRQREWEAKARARSMAAALLPGLADVATKLTTLRDRVISHGNTEFSLSRSAELVEVPSTLLPYANALHELGEDGFPVQRLIVMLTLLRNEISVCMSQAAAKEPFNETAAMANRRMLDALDTANEALFLFGKMFPDADSRHG